MFSAVVAADGAAAAWFEVDAGSKAASSAVSGLAVAAMGAALTLIPCVCGRPCDNSAVDADFIGKDAVGVCPADVL